MNLRLILWSRCSQNPLEKSVLVPSFMGFLALQVSQEGHFLADPGNSGYLGDLEKRRSHPNLWVLKVKSGGEFLAWLPRLLKFLKCLI